MHLFIVICSELVQVLKVDIIQGLAITRGKIKDWRKYFLSPKTYEKCIQIAQNPVKHINPILYGSVQTWPICPGAGGGNPQSGTGDTTHTQHSHTQVTSSVFLMLEYLISTKDNQRISKQQFDIQSVGFSVIGRPSYAITARKNQNIFK